ncbi:MAG: diphthine synthase [Nanoarchaeota archaeon]|nr:diphthine synthase [Nanoarchaeota archaeon]MBU4452511.1 diphthine synthase [Nanoarchaeota archaeon]MCG2723215.1 diphthine synthase [archaeon]
MLYVVSLGLHDENDISLRGIDALKKCKSIFIETYTSSIKIDFESLEKIAGNKIELLDRRGVEESGVILESAKSRDTAFIVPGDALSATTHHQVVFDARKAGIDVEIIHGSSIFSAIAETGLSLYKFGMTVSLPKPQENYFPESPYMNILANKKRGLHTLILLDIGMTAKEGIEILLELEKKVGKKLFTEKTKLVAVAHLGVKSTIKYGPISELKKADFGAMPHTLILPGDMHFLEEDFVSQFAI